MAVLEHFLLAGNVRADMRLNEVGRKFSSHGL
jgi:hypothetical protein